MFAKESREPILLGVVAVPVVNEPFWLIIFGSAQKSGNDAIGFASIFAGADRLHFISDS